MADPAETIAFRFLSRFRCIGGACEDDCCSGWRIDLDDETHAKLVALAAAPDAPPSFAPLRVLATTREADERWHMPRRDHDGPCLMLDEEHLCAIQRHAGEEALPVACATFPRRAARVRLRVELSATCACPEVARLLLLAEDATHIDAATLPARLAAETLPSIDPEEPHPYHHHFPLVRAALLQLLAARHLPLDARLFAIAYLGASVHAFYRHDLAWDAGTPFPLEALHHQVGLVLHPEAQAQLARTLAEVPFDPSVARVVLENLRLLGETASDRLAPLLEAALADCLDPAGEVEVRIQERAHRLASDRAAAAHHARRRALPEALAARLDGATTRYLESLTVHAWFVESSDLFLHHMAHLVRVALLRFLVLAQPGATSDLDALDRAMVAVFSTVTRAFDHDPALTTALHDAIRSMGPSTPLHAARLLMF